MYLELSVKESGTKTRLLGRVSVVLDSTVARLLSLVRLPIRCLSVVRLSMVPVPAVLLVLNPEDRSSSYFFLEKLNKVQRTLEHSIFGREVR